MGKYNRVPDLYACPFKNFLQDINPDNPLAIIPHASRSAGLLQKFLVGGLEQFDAIVLQGVAEHVHVDSQPRQLG